MRSIQSSEKPFTIIREIGEIKQGAVQTMRLDQVQWNTKKEPCYDLRWWSIEDGERKAFRGGIQLTKDEARKLRDMLMAEDLGYDEEGKK